jgi:hypothetical protein
MLALYIFMLGISCSSATVRILCLFVRCRLGILSPHTGSVFSAFVTKPFVVVKHLRAFYEQQLVQVGSVLPHTRAVYFHYWCAIVMCDGPSLILFSAFWYVFGFGGAL